MNVQQIYVWIIYKLTKIPVVFSHTWIFDPCLSPEPALHVFMITTEQLKEQPFQLVNPHCVISRIFEKCQYMSMPWLNMHDVDYISSTYKFNISDNMSM